MHKSDEPWINPGIVILCRQITQLQTKGLNFGKNLRLYASRIVEMFKPYVFSGEYR